MAETAVDRSQQSLVLYKKDGTKVSTGSKGASLVSITGLEPGAIVGAGDYQVAYANDAGTESGKVDVPAFTVVNPAALAPAGVASVATADGATITATALAKPDGYNLAVFAKADATKALAMGTANTVTLKGIAQGTSVVKGDYTVAWVKTDGGTIGAQADVPAFNVAIAVPSGVAAVATNDDAKVTAK